MLLFRFSVYFIPRFHILSFLVHSHSRIPALPLSHNPTLPLFRTPTLPFPLPEKKTLPGLLLRRNYFLSHFFCHFIYNAYYFHLASTCASTSRLESTQLILSSLFLVIHPPPLHYRCLRVLLLVPFLMSRTLKDIIHTTPSTLLSVFKRPLASCYPLLITLFCPSLFLTPQLRQPTATLPSLLSISLSPPLQILPPSVLGRSSFYPLLLPFSLRPPRGAPFITLTFHPPALTPWVRLLPSPILLPSHPLHPQRRSV